MVSLGILKRARREKIEPRYHKIYTIILAALQRWVPRLPSHGLGLLIAIAVVGSLMGGCSWFFEGDNIEDEKKAGSTLSKVPYTTTIIPKISQEGMPELVERLREVSVLISLESRPPTSLNALYYRIRNDVGRLKEALAERGYFDAKVDFNLLETQSPIPVTLTFSPGSRYKVSGIEVAATEERPEESQGNLVLPPLKAAKQINFHVGDDVDLGMIQEANQRLARYLRNHGYPYADMNDPKGQIDRDTKELRVIFRPQPGFPSRFGKTRIKGLNRLDIQFVRNRLKWREGDCFDERRLEETRRTLMGTGLFSTIDIKPEDHLDAAGCVPISVQVSESLPRTVGAGVKYATTEGLGGQAFWSHNNIFGSAEKFGAMLRLSPRLSRVKVDFDIPDIFVPEQHLRHEISATREKNRAYSNRSMEAGIRLEHPFTETVKGMVGLLGEASKSKRAGIQYVNRLIGLPLELQIDESNDLINPSKGGRLAAQITPYVGRSGKDRRLVVSTAKASYYWRALKGDKIVVAGWAHGGTVTISSLNNLAPNKRFYAGGVGSVRAYGYKLLGPLDDNRVPLGGRSILEYGLEGRFKVTDTIGFVLFAEAGSISSKASPDLSSKARLWGVGAGFRYYTDIGPIRFDIATPLKRRRDGSPKPIDSAYQFYVSIGQAF